jgi:hypothetical protein
MNTNIYTTPRFKVLESLYFQGKSPYNAAKASGERYQTCYNVWKYLDQFYDWGPYHHKGEQLEFDF